MVTSTLITAPTTEPVTITETKLHLRIDSTEQDSSIAKLIMSARHAVESYLRRALISQTWDAKYDEWPDKIELPMQPLVSVTSITYSDADDATQTLATNQYQVIGAGGTNRGCIVPAYDVTWPTTRDKPEAITVRYVAGYGSGPSSVPEPIRTAILLSVEMLYDRNPQSKDTLESARNALLDPYRVV